jgi:hypothetical protein
MLATVLPCVQIEKEFLHIYFLKPPTTIIRTTAAHHVSKLKGIVKPNSVFRELIAASGRTTIPKRTIAITPINFQITIL